MTKGQLRDFKEQYYLAKNWMFLFSNTFDESLIKKIKLLTILRGKNCVLLNSTQEWPLWHVCTVS